MTDDASRRLLAIAAQESPAALELARLVSPAPRIEAELVRAIRLEAAPHVDAGAEGDLWFGPLVDSRGAGAVTLDDDVAYALRNELAATWMRGGRERERVARARAAMRRVHAAASPALRLEEELAWIAIAGGSAAELENVLWKAVRALTDPDRPGVAHWAMQAWPRMPAAARNTRAGLMLHEIATMQLGPSRDTGETHHDIEVAAVAAVSATLADRQLVPLAVAWTATGLRLGDLDDDDILEIMVPDVNPQWLELTWRQGALRRVFGGSNATELQLASGEVVELPAARNTGVQLVTLAGDTYELPRPLTREQRAGQRAPEVTAEPSAVQPRATTPRAVGLGEELRARMLTRFGSMWQLAQRIPPVERVVNRALINQNIKFLTPPRQLTTKVDYTSAEALSDKTYSARVLPATDSPDPRTVPATDAVLELFRRTEFIPSPKSTVLFAYFAQWFTDGFLRTDRSAAPGVLRDITRNESSHEVDLCQLYGLNSAMTDQLRADDGLLKSQRIEGEEYPQFLYREGVLKPEFDRLLATFGADLAPDQKNALFAMGSDTRNMGFMAFNVLFLREHNRIARMLAAASASRAWSQDRIFATTRNTLNVLLIKVAIEGYINHIHPYHFQYEFDPRGFDKQPWMRPSRVAVEHNLLYRWHSLLPDALQIGEELVPLHQTVYRSTELFQRHGLAALIDSASRQPAGRIGLRNTSDMLCAAAERPAIDAARSARLRDYNEYRAAARFRRARSFEDITSDPQLARMLEDAYGTVDEVEFYVGLLAEDTQRNAALPPLMGRLVGQQALTQLLTNPLLTPEVYHEETFSSIGWEIIRSTRSLDQIVHRNVESGGPLPLVTLTRADWKRG